MKHTIGESVLFSACDFHNVSFMIVDVDSCTLSLFILKLKTKHIMKIDVLSKHGSKRELLLPPIWKATKVTIDKRKKGFIRLLINDELIDIFIEEYIGVIHNICRNNGIKAKVLI